MAVDPPAQRGLAGGAFADAQEALKKIVTPRIGSRVGGARVVDLERVYRAEYRRFLRVAAAIAGSEEAGHDAVQEAFAGALRGRHAYRGHGPLEAWVWRAVVNAAQKARVREVALVVDLESAQSPNGSEADEYGVRTWVAALPERQRLAVFLRYFADLDYRAIAETLDIELGTVAATLSSAHAALRKRLGEVRS
jgi:RNA polymerase sigma factor (sigma-70 family)